MLWGGSDSPQLPGNTQSWESVVEGLCICIDRDTEPVEQRMALAIASPEKIKFIYCQKNSCENPYQFGSQSKNPKVSRCEAMENENHCLQGHPFHESITVFLVCFQFSRLYLKSDICEAMHV